MKNPTQPPSEDATAARSGEELSEDELAKVAGGTDKSKDPRPPLSPIVIVKTTDKPSTSL